MKKWKLVCFCCLTELFIIVCISIACLFHHSAYYLFYNLLYGIIISVTIPLLILRQEKNTLNEVGIKKISGRQILVLFLFVFFSVGGQILPKTAAGETLPWNVLPVAILPLVMTTFFEEFLFRGFLQTRIEKEFGWGTAILLSGLLFSLYHLGYPGFRTFEDILLLFAVGIGFAVAFRLSGNNLFVSYFVNLPNAFITYILKHDQFPEMTTESTVYAGITILLLCFLLYGFSKKTKKRMDKTDKQDVRNRRNNNAE